MKTYDVIVMGGGIMGASTAYHLKAADPALNVLVIEKDLGYEKASTTLSMVNVRIQFSLRENVLISKHALEVLENFEEEMAVDGKKPAIFYSPEGNLFLHDEAQMPAARKAYEMQKELGCAIEWWTPDQIRAHYPIYENLDGIAAGSFGPRDGHLDAYAFLMGYKAKAVSMGAVFREDEVTELMVENGAVRGVKTASGETFSTAAVVNCTGAWAARLLKTADIHIPVEPVRRQVFAVRPETVPDGPLPLTVLPSGFYFRTETGGLLLLGKSVDSDPVGFDFNWEEERFEQLWGELYEFAPVFESLKLMRGWAGLYAMNRLDENSILGEWPELKGLYLANGFSGHGFQQGPAVGRYMTELITGKTPALDLSIFSPERVLANTPIRETGIV